MTITTQPRTCIRSTTITWPASGHASTSSTRWSSTAPTACPMTTSRRSTTRSAGSQSGRLAHEAALRTQAEPDPDAWMARARSVRGGLREVWDATVEGRSADAAAVELVNDTLRHVSPVRAPPDRCGHRHRPPPRWRGPAPRGACPAGGRARRGARRWRHVAVPDLRQRRLSLGVRGHVPRRPPPLVRHAVVRQPGEGPPVPLTPACRRDTRRRGGRPHTHAADHA